MKGGKIVGIGKAGNPDIMDGVTENMVIGSATEVSSLLCFKSAEMTQQVIAGEKMIVTAGALDVHVHYICPQLWKEVSDFSTSDVQADFRRRL